MTPAELSSIKPAYPHLVKYSDPTDPLQPIPDAQHLNDSSYDRPVVRVDMEKDASWARKLREAAKVRT